ncbi:hypothetical protein E2562_035181 [Oryza meyeriana var. granulata]|uniref:Uncharacterized protein n=1 Tax=Oryza meyeriana var. granulata TaxID=110450 RepID=A0A6G1CAR0_9ORYZ|nr:hypothetical protein E2562_035181 [Oryza meyeriana var. granulata]
MKQQRRRIVRGRVAGGSGSSRDGSAGSTNRTGGGGDGGNPRGRVRCLTITTPSGGAGARDDTLGHYLRNPGARPRPAAKEETPVGPTPSARATSATTPRNQKAFPEVLESARVVA